MWGIEEMVIDVDDEDTVGTWEVSLSDLDDLEGEECIEDNEEEALAAAVVALGMLYGQAERD